MKIWKPRTLIPTFALLISIVTGSWVNLPDAGDVAFERDYPKAAASESNHATESSSSTLAKTAPDFSQFKNTEEKKQAFYDYLLPMVHAANQDVMAERRSLLMMSDKLLASDVLSAQELERITLLEGVYGSPQTARSQAKRIGGLLSRVDVVPASLVVAQAAKESGWGTSRFATQGNNYFGIWCFRQGCGLKPLRRESDRNHEVASFNSVEHGVRYYVRTINTHIAYQDLRELRAAARRRQESVRGEHLASGLLRYSERGVAYVKEVQSMIRFNNLQRFTRIYRA